MIKLLIILSLICSCNFRTIDAVQTREVWVEFVKTLEIQRVHEGQYQPIILFIYEDSEGMQYRVKTYEGLRMKIHITSRRNL